MRTYPAPDPIATLVLAHGAGAGQQSAWIVKTAQALAETGISVVTFDFPYMAAGRKVPDRAPVLEAAWREVLAEVAGSTDPALSAPVFIGGKSMGGRIATHIAAQGVEGVSGMVLLGYPLHPPGRAEQRRDAHLPKIQEPVLFVQGSDDTFGNREEIEEVVQRMPNAFLHVIEGGDHSFKVRGGAARNVAIFAEVITTVRDWIGGIATSQ